MSSTRPKEDMDSRREGFRKLGAHLEGPYSETDYTIYGCLFAHLTYGIVFLP